MPLTKMKLDSQKCSLGTVNTILKRSLSIADHLEQTSIVLVFDKAIYAKAQQIRMENTTISQKMHHTTWRFSCLHVIS